MFGYRRGQGISESSTIIGGFSTREMNFLNCKNASGTTCISSDKEFYYVVKSQLLLTKGVAGGGSGVLKTSKIA